MGNSLFSVLASFLPLEALTTKLRKKRRKLKLKHRNFEIIEILKRRNFEAHTERGDLNRGISAYANNSPEGPLSNRGSGIPEIIL